MAVRSVLLAFALSSVACVPKKAILDAESGVMRAPMDAAAWLKLGDTAKHRLYLATTVGLSLLFLVVKYFEYADHFARGEYPSHSTFTAIYFTLTGLHGIHILGGVVVMLYLLGPGWGLYRRSPEQFVNRVEYTGLYWHFVDLVWIFLFPVLYLL